MASTTDAGTKGATPKHDLYALCQRLHGGKLMVTSELQMLTKLNEEIDASLDELYEHAWISRQQQLRLHKLVHMYGEKEHLLNSCCEHTNALLNAQFVASHQLLAQHDNAVTNVLDALLHSPTLVAALLFKADKIYINGGKDEQGTIYPSCTTFDLCHTIYATVYGCCILADDERQALHTLHQLLHSQLVPSPNARLMLQRGTCAFSRLYALFTEGLFASRVFLTAALHDPIMMMLSDHELFLDIDPSKAVIRFKPEQRRKRFGVEGTAEYTRSVADFRSVIVSKLNTLLGKFIDGIMSSLYELPSALVTIIRHTYTALRGQGELQAKLICTDLLFTCFICVGIANPEPLGIIGDTPITPIARFNLMQVGQMVQMLALAPYERIDERFNDIFTLFDTTCLSRVVDSVVDGKSEDIAHMYDGPSTGIERHSALCTMHDLTQLLHFVHTHYAAVKDEVEESRRTELEKCLGRLPVHLRSVYSDASCRTPPPPPPAVQSFVTPKSSNSKRSPLSKLREAAGSSSKLFAHDQTPVAKMSAPNLVVVAADSSSSVVAPVVMRLAIGPPREALGLTVTEDKYMDDKTSVSSRRSSMMEKGGCAADGSEKGKRRARFVDTASVTTRGSDMVDDVDSLSSSVDALTNAEDVSTIADNISDVAQMSANVSERASPTPKSSSVVRPSAPSSSKPSSKRGTIDEEQDDVPSQTSGNPVGERRLPLLPNTVRKGRENREDLEEKFGKFPVPPHATLRHGDEAHSIISDAWSTDVVASDNEALLAENAASMLAAALPDIVPAAGLNAMVIAGEAARLDLIREEGQATSSSAAISAARLPGSSTSRVQLEDRSDTWSVDAMPSDEEEQGGGVVTSRSNITAKQEMDELDADAMRATTEGEYGSAMYGDAVDDDDLDAMLASGMFDDVASSAATQRGESSTSSKPMMIPPSSTQRTPIAVPSSTQRTRHRHHLSSKRKAINLFQELQKVSDTLRGRGGSPSNAPSAAAPSTTGGDAMGDATTNDTRTADDVLSKYANKPTKITLTDSMNADQPLLQLDEEDVSPPPFADDPPNDYGTSSSLAHTRRKLRLVLGNVNMAAMPRTMRLNVNKTLIKQTSSSSSTMSADHCPMATNLHALLRALLADAIQSQEHTRIAQLRETIRCLSVYDGRHVRRLMRGVRHDERQRQNYIAFLQQSRYTLLHTQHTLRRYIHTVKRDYELSAECMVELLVRLLLQQNEPRVIAFVAQFQLLTMQDEKTELVDAIIASLHSVLSAEPAWHNASKGQLEQARRCIERSIIAEIYTNALFPNEDGDVCRDQMISEHMGRLSVKLSFAQLNIPAEVRGESPWPSAQNSLLLINVYKTPEDKLACIVRCCQTIEQLLSMSLNGRSPAADLITPVLVFVIIHSNPQHLLSNIEYVRGFHERRMSGEEEYWWTQFVSAVEFIKQLLNET